MATGKSYLGGRIAENLKYMHLDTDEAIEALFGKSIEEIFNQFGEAYFRNLETQMLKLTKDLDHVVVSTGGGLPMFQDNMHILLQSGITFHLECNLDTLTARIANSNRPLHQEADLESLKKAITKRMEERKSVYQDAHFTITSDDLELAVKEMNGYLKPIGSKTIL